MDEPKKLKSPILEIWRRLKEKKRLMLTKKQEKAEEKKQ